MYTHMKLLFFIYHTFHRITPSHLPPAVLFAHRAARRLDPRTLRRVARAVVPGDLQRRPRAPQQGTGVTEVGHLGIAMDVGWSRIHGDSN